MPYDLDAMGRPIFLISRLAVHTKNLQACPRASLLVVEPAGTGDLLAAARVTLMGEVERLTASAAETARTGYLRRHPSAAVWVDFEDFAFFRLTVANVYYVGGFGEMDWIEAAAYTATDPDPLAGAAPGIIAHMNTDHADLLRAYCRRYAGLAASHATMIGVDRLGFQLQVRIGEQTQRCRIAFPREVRDAGAARAALIEMSAAPRKTGPS